MVSTSSAIKYVKETMMRYGNAVSSHSGLISFETVYEKRGGLTDEVCKWPCILSVNLSRISIRKHRSKAKKDDRFLLGIKSLTVVLSI